MALVESWAMCAFQLFRYNGSLSTCRGRDAAPLSRFWILGRYLANGLREMSLPGKPGGWVERIITGQNSRYAAALNHPKGYAIYRESLTAQESRLIDELTWIRAAIIGDYDKNCKSDSVARIEGRSVLVVDGHGRNLGAYALGDAIREESAWFSAFQREADYTLQEQSLQHGRNRWINFSSLSALTKPTYRPEPAVPATEDAILEKIRSAEGGAFAPPAGAGPPPPEAEGSGAANDGPDAYYEYYATSAEQQQFREEVDSNLAKLFHKMERIEKMVTKMYEQAFPEEVAIRPPPPPPVAEPQPPAGPSPPAAGSAAAPMEQ